MCFGKVTKTKYNVDWYIFCDYESLNMYILKLKRRFVHKLKGNMNWGYSLWGSPHQHTLRYPSRKHYKKRCIPFGNILILVLNSGTYVHHSCCQHSTPQHNSGCWKVCSWKVYSPNVIFEVCKQLVRPTKNSNIKSNHWTAFKTCHCNAEGGTWGKEIGI